MSLLVVIVLIAALLFVRNVAAGRSDHRASKPAPAGPAVLQVEQAPWRLPQALSRSVVLSNQGRLLVAGGLAASNKTSRSMFELDPQSGAMAEQGALAEPVHDAAGAAVGGRSLVFGGGAAKVSATVQGLTPTASGLQAVKVGSLPAPRADLVALAVGDQVVVAAGYDGTATSPDVWSTGDGTTFTAIARLPEPVRYPAGLVWDNKVFLIGGDTPSGESNAIQQIDPTSHRATVVARLSEGVSHASVAEIGGTVLVFGGRRGGHVSDVVMQVDLSTGATSAVARLPVAVSDMAEAALGDMAYLVGGETENGQPSTGVVVAHMVTAPATSTSAAGTGAPFDDQLLIAERGNNRLLLVDADKHISWTFRSPTAPASPQGFYLPDDAFFAKHARPSSPTKKNSTPSSNWPIPRVLLATYGHRDRAGAAPG